MSMRKQRVAAGVWAVLVPLTLAACGTEPGPGAKAGDGSGTVRTDLSVTDVRWSVNSLTVGGKRTEAPAAAHVMIGPGGKISGKLGCNEFSADVRIDGDAITAGPVVRTLMGCEKDVEQFEKALFRVLRGTLKAAVAPGADDSADRTLALTTRKGDSISLTQQPPAPLTGTAWNVTGLLNGTVATSLPAGTQDRGRITFGKDGTVEGGLGCNGFRGTAKVSGSTITFGPLTSTRKMCPGARMELERAMLGVLEGRADYTIEHHVLTLTARSGKGLTAAAPAHPAAKG